MTSDTSLLPRFCVVNLGCRVNRVESDSISAALLGSGAVSSTLANCDFCIINTCAVTLEAEKKTRKSVHQALSRSNAKYVYVTGCSATLHQDVYIAMDERVQVVEKANIVEHILKDWPAINCELSDASDSECASPSRVRFGEGFKTRAGIKIQDGCNNECTYCIVHVARGKATSVPAKDVLESAKNLVLAGARELVLTGINLGTYYDSSLPGTSRLDALLAKLLAQNNELEAKLNTKIRIRLSSIEPMDVSNELIELMASSNGKICRYLHLPLQSGSTKVLQEMNRPYSAEDFKNLVLRTKNNIPQISLSTDCIVGFPGETEEEFEETYNLIDELKFMKIHVFPYSQREGTPAAARTDQIPDGVKKKRAARLRELSNQLQREDFRLRAWTDELAILEADGTLVTESFHAIDSSAINYCLAQEKREIGELVSFTFNDSFYNAFDTSKEGLK
jgi:threonylcarbamoyladenosine tRNA methylthiotransferase MtaB